MVRRILLMSVLILIIITQKMNVQTLYLQLVYIKYGYCDASKLSWGARQRKRKSSTYISPHLEITLTSLYLFRGILMQLLPISI